MKIRETSFLKARAGFQDFLANNALPTKLVWIFREDVFTLKSKKFSTDFWLKSPPIRQNEVIAERIYEVGQKRSLGICLSAFATYESTVCCCIILPKTEEDSEFLFMSPGELKFSFVSEMPKAKVTKSFLKWQSFKFLPLRYKQGCYVEYLPSKIG